MYMKVFATLDCSGGTIGIRKAVSSAQACETKNKTGQSALQVCTGFTGTIREQQTTSYFVLKCTKFAYRWRKN